MVWPLRDRSNWPTLLRLPCQKIWRSYENKIKYLRAAGYEDRDDGSCKTRIHTLINAYRSYKDECAKTGNATPKKKPAFFDEVDELLSNKPCTKPKVIIKSGNDDEEKTRAENIELDANFPGSSKANSENLDKPLNCVTVVIGKSYKMLSDWRARLTATSDDVCERFVQSLDMRTSRYCIRVYSVIFR